MPSNLDKYKKELESLDKIGNEMLIDFASQCLKEKGELEPEKETKYEKFKTSFQNNYQNWFTEASSVVKQIIPHRLEEFLTLYSSAKGRKEIRADTYSIQDWLNGYRSPTIIHSGEKIFSDYSIVVNKFQTQHQILISSFKRFESSLFDIKQLMQADLFDSELDSAKELVKKGFLRGAGAISGVVIEKHLSEICSNHNIPIRKKNPSITDYNNLLKDKDVVDMPTWRYIQRLGDLRNLCDHNKDREPTKDEVSELIEGTDKITKTVF